MSKQEEIRKVIEREIEDTLKVCGQNPITAKALAMDTSLDIVSKLHSEGVVIKAEKELPPIPDNAFDSYPTIQVNEKCATTQQMMMEAGYVAVEPLIEEAGNGH